MTSLFSQQPCRQQAVASHSNASRHRLVVTMCDVNGLVATCVFSAVSPALKGSHARVLLPVRNADVISMTTGPLSSCALPLTNREPSDLTEAFLLPK